MVIKDIVQIFYGESNPTPLGSVWIAMSGKGLLAVQIGGKEENFTKGLASRFEVPLIVTELQVAPFLHQIEDYLRGQNNSMDIPIYWGLMSSFQQKVLKAVWAIPSGETRTYGQIATLIGAPRAARAVGRANATNPMPLVIPCHRLVGADGSLRGYGSGEGIKTKAWLLNLEKGYRG